MDIGELFATVVGSIITIYVAFIVIQQLVQITPEFAQYGWLIFGALIVGIVAFFKYGLFSR
ncbi:hypothetical protein DRN76_04080 [Methanosarcinales archaeon]|nr:MAG: hypothetical protein DRN76_04080 [Methanosarcinales archaeon]